MRVGNSSFNLEAVKAMGKEAFFKAHKHLNKAILEKVWRKAK